MKTIYDILYPSFKSVAFQLDPEKVHDITMATMKTIGPLLPKRNSESDFNVKAFGLDFKNPFGLAAGLDKNAEAIDFLTHLPFSFVEVGTVTPLAQEGNDRPRLFRYPKEESLRNRMGFNNLGSDNMLVNLYHCNKRGKILGVNLGKNKITANEKAKDDYSFLYSRFASLADYLVINVSSPNTPGLRDLLSDQGLRDIFTAVNQEREKKWKPLFVKVSPDMTFDQLKSVVNLVKEFKLTGIIATNTTIMKERGDGGISGKLLYQKARETRKFLIDSLRETPNIELIGVGGFSSYADIKEYWKKGGKLVQLYTAFIYQGPSLLFKLENELQKEFRQFQVNNFDDYLRAIRSYK